MTRHGIFQLTDGATAERSRRFADTLAQIDYPWWRILPALRDDPDQAVIVRWDDTGQGVTGLYVGDRIEVVLSTREYAASNEPFVIAHEFGHLVDSTTLIWADWRDLMALLHASPATYRRDEEMLNDRVIEYAHVHDHGDHLWWGLGSDHYYLRQAEAFADLFVATFAPSLWSDKSPRFTHWTDDLEAFRALVLRKDIQVFDDVHPDDAHAEAIHWAATEGLVSGYPDGRFRPGEPVTRGQLASILHAHFATHHRGADA